VDAPSRGRVALALIVAALSVHRTASGADGPVDGAREYRTYCAVCHGVDGRGGGPMADRLTRPPTDLTLLARKNGGSFPETVVYQIVDGRRIVVFHGPREMPVWGDRFRAEGRGRDVDALVDALVGYIERIQLQ